MADEMRNSWGRHNYILMACAALNLLLAIALPFIVSFMSGVSKLQALSNYRELVDYGIIDQKALETFRDGNLNGDWALVPEWLMAGISDIVSLSYVLSLLLCLNAVFQIGIVAYRGKKRCRIPERE